MTSSTATLERARVFAALGEPSRLRIVELLRSRPHAVGEIVESLDLRQPQVSKHLRVLGQSGIVAARPDARRRIYHLEPATFGDTARWIESFEHLWDVRLDSLGSFLRSFDDDGSLDEGARDGDG